MENFGANGRLPQADRSTIGARVAHLLLRRVWLPRAIYEALPVIYICAGTIALAAALYHPGWAWIVPWAIVFGLATMHFGVYLLALRHKLRRRRSAGESPLEKPEPVASSRQDSHAPGIVRE